MNLRTMGMMATLAMVMLVASTAQAGVVRYNFAGPDANLGSDESFTSDGVTINVAAKTYRRGGGDDWQDSDIVRINHALGIDNSNVPGGNDNTGQIDNSGWYDVLAIELPATHGPLWVEFDYLGSNDDWLVGWSNTAPSFATDPTGLFNSLSDTARGDSGSYSFGVNDASINWILIGGKRTSRSGNDDFLVDTLKITSKITAVPEPAALLLLGSGLLLLGISRRRG